jgi:quercetin dioxygenase-like cupin family protein
MHLDIHEINSKLDLTNKKLDAIQTLFNVKGEDIKGKPGEFKFCDSVDLKTVFQTKGVTVSYVTYSKKDIGYPIHIHENVVEYLICTKGSFVFKVSGNFRVLDVGDCAKIPAGKDHTTIPLEDGSELIGICIPPDPAFINGG